MKKTHIYGLILLITVGCSTTAPLVKLTPSTLENKEYWQMGQQFVYANNKNIWFDCAFNRVENGKLVFDVKVTNQSDSIVLVDPSLFEQFVYKDDSLRLGYNPADDPEEVLTQLKLAENQAVAHAKNASILSICSAIFSAGASVAVAVSDKDTEKKVNTLNKIAAGNEVVQIATAVSTEANSMRAGNNWTRHRNLSEAFLRKTTLAKGYYIDGEVHFPFYKKANWYDLKFTVGNAVAFFYFKQNLIRSLDQINDHQ